jgi:hypothetical protein
MAYARAGLRVSNKQICVCKDFFFFVGSISLSFYSSRLSSLIIIPFILLSAENFTSCDQLSISQSLRVLYLAFLEISMVEI